MEDLVKRLTNISTLHYQRGVRAGSGAPRFGPEGSRGQGGSGGGESGSARSGLFPGGQRCNLFYPCEVSFDIAVLEQVWTKSMRGCLPGEIQERNVLIRTNKRDPTINIIRMINYIFRNSYIYLVVSGVKITNQLTN